MLKALKDIFTYRREVELFKDLGNGKYGIRSVYRSRAQRPDSWRTYGKDRVAITIPRDELRRLLKEIEHFYEVGALQTTNNHVG